MKLIVAFLIIGLVAWVSAQHGSVHCRVGCACAQTADPVCGSDRRTYKNECLLRCNQCNLPGLEIVFRGRCEDTVLLAPAVVI